MPEDAERLHPTPPVVAGAARVTVPLAGAVAGAGGDEAVHDGFGPLTVRVVAEGDATVVVLEGELDMAGTATLAGALAAALDESPHLVVDLGPLRFTDCGGLRVLVAAAEEARRRGGSLRVRAPQRPVRSLIERIGVGGVLAIRAGARGRGAS